MSELTLHAGQPAVAPGDIKIVADREGSCRVLIGRAAKVKPLWISDAEAALLETRLRERRLALAASRKSAKAAKPETVSA